MSKGSTKVSDATVAEGEETGEVVSGDITIAKFFDLYDAGADKYIRAYSEDRFRGIMKSKESWKAVLNLMED